MKDIPIIFSAPMVRALLDGRKTMTRRLLYTARKAKDGIVPASAAVLTGRDANGRQFAYQPVERVTDHDIHTYWALSGWHKRKAGDRLWVRENALFWIRNSDNQRDKVAAYAADGYQLETGERWTPSIHMPRWASRLTLIVTGVKIERLQEISREDAIAEGCTSRPDCTGFQDRYEGWSMDWSEIGRFSKFATGGAGPLQARDIAIGDPRHAFGSFINRLHNGDGWNLPGKPTPIWDVNPYVVALTFTVHKQNIDAMKEAA